MEDRQLRLGRVGMSLLCLGTMDFGPHTPETNGSFAILDRALERADETLNTSDGISPGPDAATSEVYA